jgi:hypothetical protein
VPDPVQKFIMIIIIIIIIIINELSSFQCSGLLSDQHRRSRRFEAEKNLSNLPGIEKRFLIRPS